MHTLKALLQVIGMVLLPMILLNIVIYGIVAFVALDANPTHWALFQDIGGRAIYALIQLIGFVSIPDFWKTISKDFDF